MSSETTVDKLDACCLTEYRPLPGTPQLKKMMKHQKKKTIVLLTDVFGLIKNPRITADELAEKSEFDVYAPDIFNGDPIPSSLLKDVPDTPGEKMSFGKFISLGSWLVRHRQSVTLSILEQFFKNLRSEKEIKRIKAVGYCFDGLYALIVGSEKLHLVDTIVGCHISQSNKNHFEQLQVPIAFACAQEDNQFSDVFRAEVEQILVRKKEIPSKFIVTEETVHGFATRPNPDNPRITEAYKQANDLIVEWAKTHL